MVVCARAGIEAVASAKHAHERFLKMLIEYSSMQKMCCLKRPDKNKVPDERVPETPRTGLRSEPINVQLVFLMGCSELETL